MAIVKLKRPSEDFETAIKLLRNLASICGMDLLKPNYTINWVTKTLFAAVTGYYVFVFLTIWRNYQDDWTVLLKATVTLGTALQGSIKIATFIYRKQDIMDLYLLLSKIFKEYEKLGEKYREALDAGLQKTKRGLYLLMLLYGTGYAGMVSVPYVWFLLKGEKSLVIEFEVPGLDVKTEAGYFATLGFQSVLLICFAFGLYCGDLLATVYLMQSFMFSYIFAAKIEYFNETVEDPNNNKKHSVTLAIHDIIEWLQLFSNYTMTCNSLFYYVITVQIATAFCSTVLSIYLIMAGGWPGAYSYVIVAFSSLYLYCILGTENQSVNDKFEHDICNIHWYNLNVPQQKLILQILCNAQNPQIIDVAGVMPLSVSTALQITKTVYSITMLMIQSFSE